jgi:hypothetical protein
MAVRVNGGGEFLVVRTRAGSDGDYWAAPKGWPAGVSPYDIDDYRPLAVIDPDDREEVERLLDIFRGLSGWASAIRRESANALQQALREFANPRPPRIAEPGVWGVVEAACCHSDERRKWVHHEDGNWWPAESYGAATARAADGRRYRLPDGWDDLINPTLIREGVTS